MPELPDVAGFQNYLKATSLHQTISRTRVLDDSLLDNISARQLYPKLKGHQLTGSQRRGKFLLAAVGGGGYLVMHFGMTGELAYSQDAPPPEYAKVLLEFDNGATLAIINKRKLGKVGFTDDADDFFESEGLGPDALSDELDFTCFTDRLEERSGKIKPALMNQSIIAGIGNVYADEILYQAAIRPTTAVNKLADKHLKAIHRDMRRVLTVAARHGGDIRKLPASYLLKSRESRGDVCPKGHDLKTSKISGRTSHHCPICQNQP
jgi:formamidopyrimidine-DNA glycosylase